VGDVVTSEYKLNLLAPALGERLLCRAEVLKAGQRQAVCRADVFAVKDSQEKLVATGLATIARV
ncbi:MAG: PaaI family thioesterase, partial [Pseudomonas sp.]|nr:PaaI family thioesterase [Pseudomonas sp.]